MTKNQIQSLIASYISKHAEEGAAHEAGETPNAEMLEHAMGAGQAEAPHGSGPGGVDVEQLLSQLSPEELQQLISQLSGGGHPGMGAPGAGGEDVPGLSQDIESHLAQNPEAQVPGAPPEKMAALNFVKSAHYIEGFIKQALDYGLNTDQAVNMYDSALTTTVDALKKEATDKMKALSSGTKSLKEKAVTGYNFAKDRISRAANSAKIEGAAHFKKNKGRYGAGAAGLAAGGAAGYAAGSGDEKKAAYLEGVFKQAMAYGFSEAEAAVFVKEATDKMKALSSGTKSLKEKALTGYNTVKDRISRGAASAKIEGAAHFKKNKGRYGAGAAGLAAGGAAGYAAGSGDEKKAAYLEGVFKQAMARGFSEAEAVQFAQQAEASL